MTAARLRLVDEAKGDTAGKRRTDTARTNEAEAPSARRKSARGPHADSDVAPRQEAAPRGRERAGKRPSTVADVMRAPAVCCQLSDSLHRVAQLMWEADVGAVVVLGDDGRALHMITDPDVCKGAYTQGVALWASHVSRVEPGPLVSCSVDAGVIEVRRLMQEHGVRRIPVLDSAGAVVGVVGLGDLVREATVNTPKARTRGLTAPQLAQTLTAIYEDVPVPAERAL